MRDYADQHRNTQYYQIRGQQKATRECIWNLFPRLHTSPPSHCPRRTLFFGSHLEDIELIELCQRVHTRFPLLITQGPLYLPVLYPSTSQSASTRGLRKRAREYQPRINPGADGMLLVIRYTSLRKIRTAKKVAVPPGECNNILDS